MLSRGLIVTLDSVVILASAIIAYVVVVGDFIEDASYYLAAICFVWLATLMFMNFAGLYLFEPIMRPLAIADKIIIAFAYDVSLFACRRIFPEDL